MNLFDLKYLYMDWDDCLKDKKVFVSNDLQIMRKVVNDNLVKPRSVEDDSHYSDMYPFKDDCGTSWGLVYYDPNYECKVAYMEGKVIQARTKGSTRNEWMNMEPGWCAGQEYRVKPEPALRVYKCSDDTLHISDSCAIDFLFEGTGEECKQYIKEHYCDTCTHQSCTMEAGTQFCKGFKEPKRKRRMTYRELAKWVAQGNGQVKNVDSSTVTSRGVEYDEGDDNKECPDRLLIRGWDEEEWHKPEVEG